MSGRKQSPRPARAPRRGRPPIGAETMRRVNVMLDEATIARAMRLGEGNLSAGIRRAIAATK